MRTWKQRMASLLAAVMLFSLLPVTSLAEEGSPLEETPAVNEEPQETAAVQEAATTEETVTPEETASPEDSLEIRELGVTVGGQYVAAVPVEELPPEEGEENAGLLSMQPIAEKRYSLKLRSFWPDQLKKATLQILNNAIDSGSIDTTGTDVKVMWAVSEENDYRGNDDFTVMDPSGQIDLTSGIEGSYYAYLHLIVGKADQFDTTNQRYLIRIEMPRLNDLFQASMATASGQSVTVYESNLYMNNSPGHFQISVKESEWHRGQYKLALAMNTTPDAGPVLANGQTAKIYAGSYDTAEAAESSGNEITSSILNQTMPAGGYLTDFGRETLFTLVVKAGGEVLQVLPFRAYAYGANKDVRINGLYADSATDVGYREYVESNSDWTDDGTEIIYLKPGYSVDQDYYISLYFDNPAEPGYPQDNGISNVKGAYKGNFADAAAAASAEDIKGALFSDAWNGGYQVNLKNPVTFTIVDTENEVYHVTCRVRAGGRVPEAPTPLSEDTYFRIEGAFVGSTPEEDQELAHRYAAYVMPYQHDSYYYNGYQTVLLLGQDGSSPLTDGTQIYPEFFSGTNVNVHLGAHTEVGETVSTALQKSGVDAVAFQNGESIQYSAAAENQKNLKNYWVTFLTRQTAPTLFVNGVTNADAEHKDTDGTPIREVILDGAHEYHHDIFIANLGASAMDDLTVTLSADARNIELDGYWKVEGTKSLDAFTTTESRTSANINTAAGELKNVAKVRLVPKRDATGNITAGEISGTLTITGGGKTETVKLKGRSGRISITTDKLVDGVKYVHYSSVIQTSNMYESGAVKFTLVGGTLPSGLRLLPSGEIYGVPSVTRAEPWHIKVRAAYTDSASGQEYTDEKEFDLTIADNTDANVWEASDTGYQILTAIVNEDNTVSLPGGHQTSSLSGSNSWSGSSQLFQSNGELEDFVVTQVCLDERPLTQGSDFTAERGSTKITIQNQTLRSRGNGTHTISVEFREGGVLKRTAQNYTLTTLGTQSSGGISGGSNGGANGGTHGGSGGGSSKPATNPTKPGASSNPGTPTAPGTQSIFQDVSTEYGLYGDIKWAFDNGLMQGVNGREFYPRGSIAQSTIVTVLARQAAVDLTQFENGGNYPTIPEGAWYSSAAVWATQAGLLPDNTSFNSEGPISRANMAIMLVKYLESLGIDVSVPEDPAVFVDEDQMSKEAYNAFQVLYRYGIFRGFGNNVMGPDGTTTRAQFAALIHRMSALIGS